MGTISIPSIRDRKAMVRYLKTDYFSGSDGYQLLDHSQAGNILYALVQHPSGYKFIAVFKLSGLGDDGWGYKAMDESVGPCFYDCPERILAQSEDTSKHGTAWRAECRRRRQAKAARKEWTKALAHGDRLQYQRGYDKDGPRYVDVVFERPHSPTFFIGHFAGETTVYRLRWEWVKVPEDTLAPA